MPLPLGITPKIHFGTTYTSKPPESIDPEPNSFYWGPERDSVDFGYKNTGVTQR